jgi:hypothetical protein
VSLWEVARSVCKLEATCAGCRSGGRGLMADNALWVIQRPHQHVLVSITSLEVIHVGWRMAAMEVQRVPRAEELQGNLRVSLYGPRSTEYQTDEMEQMELSSQPPNHVARRYVGRCHDADGQRVS